MECKMSREARQTLVCSLRSEVKSSRPTAAVTPLYPRRITARQRASKLTQGIWKAHPLTETSAHAAGGDCTQLYLLLRVLNVSLLDAAFST